MDIQKIIADVVSKLMSNPDLIRQFVGDPVKLLEKTFGIDLPDEQLNQVIKGVASKLDLGNIDIKQASSLLGKLTGLFGN